MSDIQNIYGAAEDRLPNEIGFTVRARAKKLSLTSMTRLQSSGHVN